MNMREILGLNKTTGEVGIEVEIEGENLPQRIASWWRVTADGSLRGEALEYVLAEPVDRAYVADALKTLEDAFKRKKSTVFDTGRAGTHVHLNIQNLSPTVLRNLIAIYLILEEPLVNWCGKGRVGNLFCLRAKDAEAITNLLINNMKWDDWNFQPNVCKYASLNLSAIPRYGSVEFRSMRSTLDSGVLKTWVDMLLKVKDAAASFESPQGIVQTLSGEGQLRFLNMIMGEYDDLLMCPNIEQRMLNGARIVQNWAYVVPRKREKAPLNIRAPKRMVDNAPLAGRLPPAPAVAPENDLLPNWVNQFEPPRQDDYTDANIAIAVEDINNQLSPTEASNRNITFETYMAVNRIRAYETRAAWGRRQQERRRLNHVLFSNLQPLLGGEVYPEDVLEPVEEDEEDFEEEEEDGEF